MTQLRLEIAWRGSSSCRFLLHQFLLYLFNHLLLNRARQHPPLSRFFFTAMFFRLPAFKGRKKAKSVWKSVTKTILECAWLFYINNYVSRLLLNRRVSKSSLSYCNSSWNKGMRYSIVQVFRQWSVLLCFLKTSPKFQSSGCDWR